MVAKSGPLGGDLQLARRLKALHYREVPWAEGEGVPQTVSGDGIADVPFCQTSPDGEVRLTEDGRDGQEQFPAH